ncbi:MAG: hypothetical protein J1E78_03425 [Muribaculaceae bacterium]|nr:hypothetical protein [Muribaculaceae bacterium]
MALKKYIKSLIIGLSVTLTIPAFISCSNEPGGSPYVDNRETTVLIYAVATNSLSSNLISDKNEMLQAAASIDLKKNSVIVFENTYTFGQRLLELKYNGSEYEFEVIEEFPDTYSSLDPRRMGEVFEYMTDNYESKRYGLIFWSHSTASQPYITSSSTSSKGEKSTYSTTEGAQRLTSSYSFGSDNNAVLPEYVQINVDELADAIPAGLFTYIWFDSCYMSNIETIYQMREKSKYFVGYATEVWEFGLPYHIVLPYLVGSNPDLVAGAELFFKYYDESNYRNATIAVIDLEKIEALAEICADVYEPMDISSITSMIKYTRGSTGPFFDLGDYSKAIAESSGKVLTAEEWNGALDKCVVYKAATPTGFDGTAIDPARFSGISTHIYSFNDNTTKEKFYQSLDWFNRVF